MERRRRAGVKCQYLCIQFVCEVGGCVCVTSAEKEITSGQKGASSYRGLSRKMLLRCEERIGSK